MKLFLASSFGSELVTFVSDGIKQQEFQQQLLQNTQYLASSLPTRSYLRKPLLYCLCHQLNVKEAAAFFSCSPSTIYSSKKIDVEPLLTSSQIGLKRDKISELEEKVTCEWIKRQCYVKSGCRQERYRQLLTEKSFYERYCKEIGTLMKELVSEDEDGVGGWMRRNFMIHQKNNELINSRIVFLYFLGPQLLLLKKHVKVIFSFMGLFPYEPRSPKTFQVILFSHYIGIHLE